MINTKFQCQFVTILVYKSKHNVCTAKKITIQHGKIGLDYLNSKLNKLTGISQEIDLHIYY